MLAQTQTNIHSHTLSQFFSAVCPFSLYLDFIFVPLSSHISKTNTNAPHIWTRLTISKYISDFIFCFTFMPRDLGDDAVCVCECRTQKRWSEAKALIMLFIRLNAQFLLHHRCSPRSFYHTVLFGCSIPSCRQSNEYQLYAWIWGEVKLIRPPFCVCARV